MQPIPLILGGHSTIAQLGNDPKPDDGAVDRIVRACLDAGISTFDTTYRPERIALGHSLKRLNAHSEAKIIVWNFFNLFDDAGEVGGPDYYRPEHLSQILADVQAASIDSLVVHRLDDARRNDEQESLAIQWKREGRVKHLGLWSPGKDILGYARRGHYDFVVEPLNPTEREAADHVRIYQSLGLRTYACSPYVRGWELDKMVAAAVRVNGMSEPEARDKLADFMLRYSLFHPHVDQLIVSMRRPEWVGANVGSVRRGPLNAAEIEWMMALRK